jgi:hypothetical protein
VTVDLGDGAHAVLARPCRGTVVAVYRRAAYLRLDGETGSHIVALVDASLAAGPLHVRCAVLPPLRAGERVASDGTRLAGGHWALRVDGPVWRGALPRAESLVREPSRPVAVDPEVEDLVRGGRLEELAARVGGRGPGLTPSGDDVLAGVLVVARLLWGPAAGPRLDAVAAGVVTTEIARAFLAWAARGQCIAPVHDWLAAVASGRPEELAAAQRSLVAVGASSGAHLAAGLALAVSQLPRTASQIARAGPEPLLRQSAGRSPG